ncbi:hypothetical protein GCM10010252_77240 [Streptomyces aureoverticillatus]|nr:hypothetical protein GCM10010252_77240 [Streptomyces aureoverticillatus]
MIPGLAVTCGDCGAVPVNRVCSPDVGAGLPPDSPDGESSSLLKRLIRPLGPGVCSLRPCGPPVTGSRSLATTECSHQRPPVKHFTPIRQQPHNLTSNVNAIREQVYTTQDD